MQIDPELSKLIAQVIVSIIIEVGKLVINHQRTQARDGRRLARQRQTSSAAMQRIARRHRRARLAARQQIPTPKQTDE